MAKFTVRVEILDGTISDHDRLEKIMLEQGFDRSIRSDSGRIYKLPPGEFNYAGEIERQQLREKVQACAGQLGKSYSLLITESKGRSWFNLNKLN